MEEEGEILIYLKSDEIGELVKLSVEEITGNKENSVAFLNSVKDLGHFEEGKLIITTEPMEFENYRTENILETI